MVLASASTATPPTAEVVGQPVPPHRSVAKGHVHVRQGCHFAEHSVSISNPRSNTAVRVVGPAKNPKAAYKGCVFTKVAQHSDQKNAEPTV